jgi:hypothetical protein
MLSIVRLAHGVRISSAVARAWVARRPSSRAVGSGIVVAFGVFWPLLGRCHNADLDRGFHQRLAKFQHGVRVCNAPAGVSSAVARHRDLPIALTTFLPRRRLRRKGSEFLGRRLTVRMRQSTICADRRGARPAARRPATECRVYRANRICGLPEGRHQPHRGDTRHGLVDPANSTICT